MSFVMFLKLIHVDTFVIVAVSRIQGNHGYSFNILQFSAITGSAAVDVPVESLCPYQSPLKVHCAGGSRLAGS